MNFSLTPKTVVVIPTYNEAENIKALCEEIFKYLDNCQIIIVDDNSLDGTQDIITGLAINNSNISPLIRSGKPRSFSQSYIDGFAMAIEMGAGYIIQMDADFSHQPLYLPEIAKGLAEADLVIGSRYVKGGGTKNWSFWRSFLSRGGSFLASKVTATPIKDITGGFAGWRRELLSKIDFDSINTSGFVFQIEIRRQAHNNNAKIKEVPIVFENRKRGRSKMNKKIITEAIIYCLNLPKNNAKA